MSDVTVRPARTQDVRAIRDLVDYYSPDGRLLSKATVTLFEDIQEFLVAERDGQVVGCGALHVLWEGGEKALPLADKTRLAQDLVALIAERYHARH